MTRGSDGDSREVEGGAEEGNNGKSRMMMNKVVYSLERGAHNLLKLIEDVRTLVRIVTATAVNIDKELWVPGVRDTARQPSTTR